MQTELSTALPQQPNRYDKKMLDQYLSDQDTENVKVQIRLIRPLTKYLINKILGIVTAEDQKDTFKEYCLDLLLQLITE